MIYIEPDRDDFLTQLNVVDEPLASLPLERVGPGRKRSTRLWKGFGNRDLRSGDVDLST